MANIEAALSSVRHSVFNVGTGTYSINEVANMFGSKIEYLPARPGEASITQADISEIKLKIGWKPSFNLKEYINTVCQKHPYEHC